MRRYPIVLIAVAGLASGATAAAADTVDLSEAAWTPTATVAEKVRFDSYESAPNAVFASSGDGVVWWAGETGPGGSNPAARTWRPTEGWGAVARSPRGVGGEAAYDMRVDARGTIHVMSFSRWGSPDNPQPGVGYGQRLADGGWTPLTDLDTGWPFRWVGYGRMDVAPNGAVCASWVRTPAMLEPPGRFATAERAPDGTWAWAPDSDYEDVGDDIYPLFFVTADDAGCRDRLSPIGPTGVLNAARYVHGVGWMQTEPLPGAPTVFSHLQADADQNGRSTAVWVQKIGGRQVVRAAERRGAAGWTAAVTLSAADTEAYGPRLQVAPTGERVVTWVANQRVWEVHSTAAGGWEPATAVSPVGQVAKDAWGSIASGGTMGVVWTRAVGEDRELHARVRHHTGVWTAPTPMDAYSRDATIAVDPRGRALVAWSTVNGIFARTLDATAPAIARVDVPGQVVVGESTTYTAVVDDPTATITWTFDNGSRATGATVVYRHLTAGPATVAVTASRPQGARTRREVTVDVVLPAAVPPAPTPTATTPVPTPPVSTPTPATATPTGTTSGVAPRPPATSTSAAATPPVPPVKVQGAGAAPPRVAVRRGTILVSGVTTVPGVVVRAVAARSCVPRARGSRFVLRTRVSVPGAFTVALRPRAGSYRPGCRVSVYVGARKVATAVLAR